MNSGGRKFRSHSLVFAVAIAALLPFLAHAQNWVTKPIKLDTFSSVQVCLPFDVLILPVPPGSGVGNYALVASAENSVLGAIQQDVNNGTLQLQLGSSISSTYPVQLTVFLPATELKSVASSSGIGEVSVGPGFNVSTLNIYSAFGTANMNVFNLTANRVNVASSGTGQIFVNGSIGSAYVAAAGTSQVYVAGLNQSANVNLGGAASAVFGFNNASGVITGITTGSNSVTSNVPSCHVQTAFLFGAPCLTQNPLTLPTINPIWSCGVNVTGNMTCPAGGIASAATSASAGVTFTKYIPAFLAPSTSASASATSSASALAPAGIAISTVPPSPLDGAVESVSPSGTTVINVGSGNREATASGPGSQTAIAVSGDTAANQQAALNNLVAGRKLLSSAKAATRKLQQSGNAALDALLASLNNQASSVSVSSSSSGGSTPGTYTYSTGPGSLACAYANGQGGCQGGLLGSNNLVGSSSSSSDSSSGSSSGATPAATVSPTIGGGLFNTGGSSGGNVVSSSSSSVSNGNGPPIVTTYTSGPGASASATGCSTVNGVSNCEQSVNGAPAVAVSGTTFFNSPITVPPTPDFPNTGTRIVATTSTSGGTSITGTSCSLPQNVTSLNIFGSS